MYSNVFMVSCCSVVLSYMIYIFVSPRHAHSPPPRVVVSVCMLYVLSCSVGGWWSCRRCERGRGQEQLPCTEQRPNNHVYCRRGVEDYEDCDYGNADEDRRRRSRRSLGKKEGVEGKKDLKLNND